MALIAPVLIGFLFGIFEMGWAAHCGATVRYAVERSARVLISNPNTTAATIQTAVQGRLNGVPVNNLSIALAQETISTGQVIRVSWTYSYNTALPFVPSTLFTFNSSMIVPLTSP
jgi:Flp pilus assembly protein TadG